MGETTGDRKKQYLMRNLYTIEEHFRKQRRLAPQGIKILSLFFIDRVDNDVLEEGAQIVAFFRNAFD